MTFSVVQPPKDENQFAEVGKELYEAGKALGINLDAEGFLYAWAQGTRVIVRRDATNTIVGFALVTVGQRWLHSDFTASVLAIRGEREPMVEFIKTICNALGATSIFIEDEGLVEDTPTHRRYTVQEIILQ